MSKKVDAKITCPGCGHHFDFSLYRSIWGEYPENRELVMSDKINVATCPSCKKSTKLVFPFIYTNVKQFFAVWWEPEYDPQIDKDTEGYKQMFGSQNYLATAPRVKDWGEFKNTIIRFENGELKGNPGIISGALKNKTQKNNQGCLGTVIILLILSSSVVYGASILFNY